MVNCFLLGNFFGSGQIFRVVDASLLKRTLVTVIVGKNSE